jgi:membrane associated rhomboid family serine protease
MFPIRDHNPSRRFPVVTITLIAINVLVFLLFNLRLGGTPGGLEAFFAEYAAIPARITYGEGYYTLITSMFMHAGFMHIAGNMLFLWIFGDNLEDTFGHVGFLLFYLASGLAADFAHIVGDPQSMVPTVGASGAIAGVMGGYLLLFPQARVDVLIIFIYFIRMIALPAWMMLGFWFGLQLFNSVVTFGGGGGGVAYLAHSGGFVAGALLTLPAFLRRGGRTFWQRTHGHPDHAPTAATERVSTVPRVGRRR